jgi:hypothetical protein
MSDEFRAFNNRYIVPLSMFLMIFGFVALCQPWSRVLHTYSVTITLVGLVLFSIFARFGPSPHNERSE